MKYVCHIDVLLVAILYVIVAGVVPLFLIMIPVHMDWLDVMVPLSSSVSLSGDIVQDYEVLWFWMRIASLAIFAVVCTLAVSIQ